MVNERVSIKIILSFGGMGYRTSCVNETVELVYKLGEGFSKNKKGQISNKTNLPFFCCPARTFLEPFYTRFNQTC